MERDEEIRLIAYKLWQQEGCPEGHDLEHWARAEAIWREQKGQERSGGQGESLPQNVKNTKKRAKTRPQARRPRQKKTPSTS